MIEKVEIITNMQPQTELEKSILRVFNGVATKLNEVIDAVNELQKHTDRLSCAILDLATPDGENKALKSIQAEPKTRSENVQPDIESRSENVQDKFAEQRKWLNKLCWFWNDGCSDYIGVLWGIHDLDENPFENDFGEKYQHCRPVKPDDDIIYKGGDNDR